VATRELTTPSRLMTWQMRGALVAGDVITTATAGAEGAARIGNAADPAQRNGAQQGAESRDGKPDREATATGPQAVAPGNLQLPASPPERETETAPAETAPAETAQAKTPQNQTTQNKAASAR